MFEARKEANAAYRKALDQVSEKALEEASQQNLGSNHLLLARTSAEMDTPDITAAHLRQGGIGPRRGRRILAQAYQSVALRGLGSAIRAGRNEQGSAQLDTALGNAMQSAMVKRERVF